MVRSITWGMPIRLRGFAPWNAVSSSTLTWFFPARLAELKAVAPEVEFIPAKDEQEATKVIDNADAVIGFCTADILKGGKALRWVHVDIAGLDKIISPELSESKLVLTNAQRIH